MLPPHKGTKMEKITHIKKIEIVIAMLLTDLNFGGDVDNRIGKIEISFNDNNIIYFLNHYDSESYEPSSFEFGLKNYYEKTISDAIKTQRTESLVLIMMSLPITYSTVVLRKKKSPIIQTPKNIIARQRI